MLLALTLTLGYFASRKAAEEGKTSATTSSEALASDTADGEVAMTVNGEPVSAKLFAVAADSVPEQMKEQVESPAGARAVARELVRMKVLEQEAEKLGLDKDPKIRAMIALDTANILASAAVDKLSKEISPAELQKLYDTEHDKFAIVGGRQILIAYDGSQVPVRGGKSRTEAQAKALAERIVERVKKGESFTAIARAESDDPAAPQQGGSFKDLHPAEVPAEIRQVLFELPPNQVSQPIKSRYGYHVFLVQKKDYASFDEVKDALQREAQRRKAEKVVEDLTGKAKVDYNEKVVPPEPKESAAAEPTAAAPSSTAPKK